MELAYILDLIRQHGQVVYALMLGYAAAHSLLMVLFAGYVAHGGALDWTVLLLVCWGGSFAGDAVRFWIGRRFGSGWLARFPRVQRGMDKTARLVDRHYWWLPLIHRYPNGIRTLAGFAFGMSNLPQATFHGLNFLSAGLWATLVLSAGYLFGHASEQAMNNAASTVGIAALALFLGVFWLLSRQLEQVLERN